MASQMWFGIPGVKLQWVPCPSITSTIARNRYLERMQFENGGGDARRSPAYQMQYDINVSGPAHEVEGIDAFNKFAQGFYGNEYVYAAYPTAFETNLFAAAWASPGLIEQGWANIATTAPTFSNTSANSYLQPRRTATFNITDDPNAYTKKQTIIIPPTHTLYVGASAVLTGNAVIRVVPTLTSGVLGTAVDLTTLSHSANTRMNASFSGATYSSVDVYLTRTSNASTVRTNLVTNPSLEANATGWSSYAGVGGATTAALVTDPYVGLQSWKLTWTTATSSAGGGPYFAGAAVTVGQTYYSSAYVKASKNQTIQATIEWKNAGGSLVSAIAGTATAVTAGAWTRISVTGVAPATAVTATLTFYVASTGSTWAINDTMQIDGLLFEKSSTLGTYFDGSTTNTTGVTHAWTGTAGASTSTETIQNSSTVILTSMMARLYQTGTTPVLTGNHYQGEGSTGLMFADDAIVETYSYMYPPRKGIATSLIEVEAWR